MIRNTEKRKIRAGTAIASRSTRWGTKVERPGGSESARRLSIPWSKSPTSRMIPAKISLLMARPSATASRRSLPLDRAGRFGGDIVDDAVHAFDLVDDAGRDGGQDLVREPRPIRRHGVLADYGAERDDLRVRPVVAHDPHGAHRQQHGEGLPERAAQAGGLDLLLHDGVGIPDHAEPLFGHL